MLLGFHGATTMTSDLETDIRVSAQAGFHALELWAAKIDTYLATHTLADLDALLRRHGVAPMSINSIEFIAFRGEEQALVRARCEELCRIAAAIGCPTVVVVPSPTPSRETSWAEVVTAHAAALAELAGIAAPTRTRLAFEFLGFGWCSVRTPRGAWEIVQAAGCEDVGLVFDCAHYYGGGGTLDEIDHLDPARILALHLDDLEDGPKEAITDGRRLLPGLGVVPLDDICGRLQAIGYDGPCSIELFRPEYWAWEPGQTAARAREAALRVLERYFTLR